MRIKELKENISAQQRQVRQLPADFHPPKTSPQLSGPYPGRNATRGYLVGENANNENPMARAVIGRIMRGRTDILAKYGPEAVMQAVDDVTADDGDWEEIGSSDVSAYVRYVEDYLRDHHGSREEMADRRPFAESATTEDVLSTMKKKLGDYLQDVATAIRKDPDLKDKIPQDIDKISAVKTIRTDDGHEIKIHGNEDDGFRISIKNRDLAAKFRDLDEAVMATEMYCARRRKQAESRDYRDEKTS